MPKNFSIRARMQPWLKWITIWGVNPVTTVNAIRGLPFYFRDLFVLRAQQRKASQPFAFGPAYLCLGERFSAGGVANGHYFHQDLLVAQRLHQLAPTRHVDVGSRVDGFVAHVASFRAIEVLDIRALNSQSRNISFLQGDLMQPLPAALNACTDSLSCLHALEHFGLGRYGDPVDHDGYLKGYANLAAMVRPGGRLYLSVPMGPQRIEFNAHRVFALQTLLDLSKPHFELHQFSYVNDVGDLIENAPLQEALVADNYGCRYGLAILELIRRPFVVQ